MKEIGNVRIDSGQSDVTRLCDACDLHTRDYHIITVGERVLLMCDHCCRQLANVILKGNINITRSAYMSKKCLTASSRKTNVASNGGWNNV